MSIIKDIAIELDDVELFKVACEMEKRAGLMSAIQTAGEQLTDYAHKKGFHNLGTILNNDVSDVDHEAVGNMASKLNPPKLVPVRVTASQQAMRQYNPRFGK